MENTGGTRSRAALPGLAMLLLLLVGFFLDPALGIARLLVTYCVSCVVCRVCGVSCACVMR
jgi:hypothetical protein